MNILYIAFSCKPNKGSEEKIGWNVPMESAKTNRVFVLTKEEHRNTIERHLKTHNVPNIKFYFADIPKWYKKICSGPFWTLRLNVWHKKALALVEKICREEKIDIIHQITPIEFRSIGQYHKIKNIKFVCGPLGGGESLPKALRSYAKGYWMTELGRSVLNHITRIKYRISHQLDQCDAVLFANRETEAFLAPLLKNVNHARCFDNGISENEINHGIRNQKTDGKFHILVAGRLAYRKGHRFLLDVLKELPKDLDFECRILGDGPEMNKLKRKCGQYRLDNRVVFIGKIPYTQMQEEYDKADVFIMPSIRETTGAVLLEAMSKGILIITIDKFGGPVLFGGLTECFYGGDTAKEYRNDLKKIILYYSGHPDMVREKGEKLRQISYEHTWGKKMEYYNSIYKEITEK